jgi:hypothetical protein
MFRILAVIITFAVSPADGADASPAQPRTMRLDYFHTGGSGIEVFSVDRVVVEPLAWPGNPAHAIDGLNLGSHRFEVRDVAGKVLFARGFASIYSEWILTEPATREHRTFAESVRFPMPDDLVDVVVFARNAGNAFEEVWRTRIDPGAQTVDTAHPPEHALIAIEENGTPADKVDLLLLGDGYTQAQCREQFRAHASRMVNALFAHEPFKRRRQDFNVWGLCPPAAQAGISRPSTGVHRYSPVGATYDAFGSERYVLTFENRRLRDVAAWAPYDVLEILANAETYGGGGIYNLFSTVAVRNDWAEYVFVHEFGHHFAALADEYYTSPVEYLPPEQIVEPWEPNVTAVSDFEQLKWKALMNTATPVPTPWPKQEFEAFQKTYQTRRAELRRQNRPESEMSALFREERAYTTRLFEHAKYSGAVGAFQGANYDAQAFYRSQLDCVMFTRDDVPFCRACQAAIEAVIDSHATHRP